MCVSKYPTAIKMDQNMKKKNHFFVTILPFQISIILSHTFSFDVNRPTLLYNVHTVLYNHRIKDDRMENSILGRQIVHNLR